MTKLKRYKPIIIFVILTLIGMIAYYISPEGFLWRFYDALGVATTIALAVIAFFGYLEYIKLEDVIKIYFDVDGNEEDTKLTVLRKNCTRSEVQGLIGMIYMGEKRYNIESFNKNRDILKVIDDAQTGKSDKLVIKVTPKELEQFNI